MLVNIWFDVLRPLHSAVDLVERKISKKVRKQSVAQLNSGVERQVMSRELIEDVKTYMYKYVIND